VSIAGAAGETSTDRDGRLHLSGAPSSQLALSVTQRLTHNFRVYADAMNLNDALLRYYQSVPDRVLQEEHDHWWMTFGVKAVF